MILFDCKLKSGITPTIDYSYAPIKGKRINQFILDWNDLSSKDKPSFRVGDFDVRVVYHTCKELYRGGQYEFAQDLFTSKDKPKIPTIHLTLFDIFKEDDKLPLPPAHRYKKIVDSSIWNYHVPIEIKDGKIDYERFNNALNEISFHYSKNHYNLNVTREYADLNARLVKQSFLEGGHKAISPFLFHSEKEMKEKKDKEDMNHDVTLPMIRKYRWRILLLDDKGIEPMSVADENDAKHDEDPKVNEGDTPASSASVNKLQIIANNLTRILGFEEKGIPSGEKDGESKIWFRTFDFPNGFWGKYRQQVQDEENGNSYFVIREENGTKKRITDVKVIYPGETSPNGEFITIHQGRVENGHYNSAYETPKSPDDVQVVIDCVKTLNEAQYCLQKCKYEIIMLDYLLAEVNGKQEYGYELLRILSQWHKEKRKRKIEKITDPVLDNLYVPGPNKRFHFMFISAFTTAVQERMLEQGFNRTEPELWYIGDGACPSNTPYLFAYQLLLMMRHRLTDIKKENEGCLLSIIDLLEEIYVKKGEAGTEETRQKAHEHFNHVLFMRDKYKTLENDFSKDDENHLKQHPNDANYLINMESSLLVQSAFKIVNLFSGAFFEHLQHLVYLTAFGTIRQWQDMWEEYVFVSKELCDYDILVNEKVKGENDEEKLVRRGKAVSDAIREYIINLKENNY